MPDKSGERCAFDRRRYPPHAEIPAITRVCDLGIGRAGAFECLANAVGARKLDTLMPHSGLAGARRTNFDHFSDVDVDAAPKGGRDLLSAGDNDAHEPVL
jgi:hypothetical protein